MRFIRGDSVTLGAVSARFAACYGSSEPSAVAHAREAAVVISERMVAQYRRHPEAFEQAMETYGSDSDGLRRAAADLAIPLYTFVYGIPESLAVAMSSPLTAVEVHAAIIAGDIEPDILQAVIDRQKQTYPTQLFTFENYYVALGSKSFNEYNIRRLFCQNAFKQHYAYALLLAGTDPDLIGAVDLHEPDILASVLLGADINYTLSAYAQRPSLDPRQVARAYHEGVATEYVGAL